MSFMTTNMFAPRIWGFDAEDSEMRVARAAGWSRADLVWERLTEAALGDWEAGRQAQALRGFRQAHLLAWFAFAGSDLRRAASHANLAIVASARGRLRRAERHQRAALTIWRGAPERIAAMEIRPRARSSLFHLRMEALHRDTYHDNLRLRITRIADETGETLRTLTASNGAGHRHAARWRGEKPGVHDGTRQILGACLLIIDRA